MRTLVSIFAAVLVVVATPLPARALDISLISMSPATTDITDQFPFNPPAEITQFVYAGTVGQEYTAVFQVSEQPGPLVGVGADISSLTYDETSSTVTVIFTNIEQLEPIRSLPDHFILAFSSVREGSGRLPPGERGAPPSESRGTYMSTNLRDWEVIPPSETSPSFGYQLGGPKGETGVFKMLIPYTLIDKIGELSGKTLDPDDLAIFNDSQQVSIDLEQQEDGVLVNLSVVFSSNSTRVIRREGPPPPDLLAAQKHGSADDSSSVDKTLTVAEKKALSITATKLSVGSTASLYGFVKDNETLAGSNVIVQRKVSGKWRKVASSSVGSDGSFSKKIKTSTLGSGSTFSLRAKSPVSGVTSEAFSLTKK